MPDRSGSLLAALGMATLGGVAAVLPRMRRDVREEGALRPSTTTAMYGVYTGYAALFGQALRRGHRHRIPSLLRLLAGAAALGGAGVAAAGMTGFRSAGHVSGLGEPELVTDGVYRVTRNPQYLGLSVALAGTAVAAGSPAGLAVATGYPLVTDRWIRVEEQHLAERFGDAYRDWCARTPRWLGHGRSR